jgi:hypothetical protein
MLMRKYKPEQIVTLLRQIEVEIAHGKISTWNYQKTKARLTALDYLTKCLTKVSRSATSSGRAQKYHAAAFRRSNCNDRSDFIGRN